nr:SRPBCC domain-containing protein [Saprospiraceae bacterium]
MKKLKFTTHIQASPERVWKCLWDPEDYKIWTHFFHEGSYYRTDGFKEGNKIHFLTPEGDGLCSRFVSIVENKHLSLKHLGEIKNYKEMPIKDETKSWAGGMETYTLQPVEGGTKVVITTDILEEYIEFMNTTYPLALSELKRISEQK